MAISEPIQLVFALQTEQTGDLIDAAVNVGATRIDGINFIASDSAISAAKQEALTEATQDAQKQADTVLATLNLTRQEIVNIVLDGAVISPPQPILLTGEDQTKQQS